MDLNPRAVMGGNSPPPSLDVPSVDGLKRKHAELYRRLTTLKAKITRVKDLQPTSVEHCSMLEEVFAEGRDLANDAERKRVEEKDPYLEAGKTIDGLFNGDFRDFIGVKEGTAKALFDRAARWRIEEDNKAKVAAAAAAKAAREEADKAAEQARRQEAAGKVRQADAHYDRADALDQKANALEAQAASSEPVRAATASGRSVSAATKKECTAVNRDGLDLERLRPYLKPADLVAAVNAGLKNGAFQDGLKGAVFEDKIVGRVR